MPNQNTPTWQKLLDEMEKTGMSRVAIARAVGLSPASVTNMLNGKVRSTEYSNGLRILAAHKAAICKARKVAA